MSERFDKFTPGAKRVLVLAQEEAQRLNHNYIGTEHLLLGLVREGEGIAAGVLEGMGATMGTVRTEVLKLLTDGGQARPTAGTAPTKPASASPGHGMSPAELQSFLTAPWNARVGCLDDDGAPYVVPVWYEWDGQDFWLVPRARSAWARYLQRDGRVCLCVDQDTPPHHRVLVKGRAEIVEQPNVGGAWVPIAERMAARYLGPDGGPRYLVPTLDRPRWLIRIRPDTLTSWAGGGWHPRYLQP
jgi:PPOX class probable F420-dependent enzyme